MSTAWGQCQRRDLRKDPCQPMSEVTGETWRTNAEQEYRCTGTMVGMDDGDQRGGDGQ